MVRYLYIIHTYCYYDKYTYFITIKKQIVACISNVHGWIRTIDAILHTTLAGRRHKPLGHVNNILLNTLNRNRTCIAWSVARYSIRYTTRVKGDRRDSNPHKLVPQTSALPICHDHSSPSRNRTLIFRVRV